MAKNTQAEVMNKIEFTPLQASSTSIRCPGISMINPVRRLGIPNSAIR